MSPTKRKKAAAKKKKTRKSKGLDLRPLKHALGGMTKVASKALAEGDQLDPEEHLPELKEAVQQMQEALAGFKREVKRRMLADPRLKDGTIRTPGALIHLKLRRGAKAESKNPDDYDVVREAIQ